jgi:hypothetical protein
MRHEDEAKSASERTEREYQPERPDGGAEAERAAQLSHDQHVGATTDAGKQDIAFPESGGEASIDETLSTIAAAMGADRIFFLKILCTVVGQNLSPATRRDLLNDGGSTADETAAIRSNCRDRGRRGRRVGGGDDLRRTRGQNRIAILAARRWVARRRRAGRGLGELGARACLGARFCRHPATAVDGEGLSAKGGGTRRIRERDRSDIAPRRDENRRRVMAR